MNKSYILIPIVILKTRNGFSAHSPAISGCVATDKTIDKTLERFKEAFKFHIEGEKLVKNKIQKPKTILKDAFDDYGTDAFYATIKLVA